MAGHEVPSNEGGSLEHPDLLRTFQHLSDSILHLAKQHAESAEKLAAKLSDSVRENFSFLAKRQAETAEELRNVKQKVGEGETAVPIAGCPVDKYGWVLQELGLTVSLVTMEDSGSQNDAPTLPKFCWDDPPEAEQEELYMKHLNELVTLEDSNLEWKSVSKDDQFLSVSAGKDLILKGTADVVAVDRKAAAHNLDLIGTVLTLGVAKQMSDSVSVRQAILRLLAQAASSTDRRPLSVLSDLQDDWRFFWIYGRSIHSLKSSRTQAVSILKEVLLSKPTALTAKLPGFALRTGLPSVHSPPRGSTDAVASAAPARNTLQDSPSGASSSVRGNSSSSAGRAPARDRAPRGGGGGAGVEDAEVEEAKPFVVTDKGGGATAVLAAGEGAGAGGGVAWDGEEAPPAHALSMLSVDRLRTLLSQRKLRRVVGENKAAMISRLVSSWNHGIKGQASSVEREVSPSGTGTLPGRLDNAGNLRPAQTHPPASSSSSSCTATSPPATGKQDVREQVRAEAGEGGSGEAASVPKEQEGGGGDGTEGAPRREEPEERGLVRAQAVRPAKDARSEEREELGEAAAGIKVEECSGEEEGGGGGRHAKPAAEAADWEPEHSAGCSKGGAGAAEAGAGVRMAMGGGGGGRAAGRPLHASADPPARLGDLAAGPLPISPPLGAGHKGERRKEGERAQSSAESSSEGEGSVAKDAVAASGPERARQTELELEREGRSRERVTVKELVQGGEGDSAGKE